MDSEKSDGGEGEQEVEDEFACSGMLRGSLASLHASVERIFRVFFRIGTDKLPHNNGQIWLKLRGTSNNVKAAKLFVKGVVNQEQQQEVCYPGVLHCVFCGAKGLFMDCLIKNTSAHIVVGSPGFLLISGLTEPVVRACSLITDLVERYKGTQSRCSETGDRDSGESLDSRRAFKCLVEKWEDIHILDLLVLPGQVKEILLDLVRESGFGSSPAPHRNTGIILGGEFEDKWDTGRFNSTDRQVDGLFVRSGKDVAAKDPSFYSPVTSASTRGSSEGAKERLVYSPQEGQPEQVKKVETEEEEMVEEEAGELLLSVGTKKEFGLLLKFFTAMGYTENVVKRVLARTGPKEASQILDLVQQEQDHSNREQKEPNWTGPCETEHREAEEPAGATGGETERNMTRESQEREGLEITRDIKDKGNAKVEEGGNEEDFVLGVLKKAAASCGYQEEKVAEVYSTLPDLSTRQLLLKLQQEVSRETDPLRNNLLREEPREVDDVVLEREGQMARTKEEERRRNKLSSQAFFPEEKQEADVRGMVEVSHQTTAVAEPDLVPWMSQPQQLSTSQYTSKTNQNQLAKSCNPKQSTLPEVRGPPLLSYPSSIEPPLNFQTPKQTTQTYPSNVSSPFTNTPEQTLPTHNVPNTNFHLPKEVLATAQPIFIPPQPSVFKGSDSSSARARQRRGFPSTLSGVLVTGEQRFMEGLATPFDLKLTDKPGDPKLRTIVIDGSNVAMSHGLGHFFSCRGIALAVQHFWDRGHRHISTMLPQWRQKSDPRMKEQHYLVELQKLGLLSYTPSREVQGKRISSYDDRFMLQLAQKTDGVIVTNDNLRDLLDESPVFRDIIKKRLLQYTFVGDHFMVPDDPLGRAGPHLDDFLRTEHRPPHAGNHSFAGVASHFSSSKPPRSQTEVLNYRDRTLGGALDPAIGGSWGKDRGQGRGWDVGQVENSRLGLGAGRSPEQTAGLRERLCQVFPGQDSMVTLVLQSHPSEKDINLLSDLILEQQLD
ncbi:hypothetical protein LDENG_00081380 [Lucifuga dentata]|nr:hypothetical protein LDENG_00081380 [Lucifuga dentata]